jgi:hypothetical protein
MKHLRTQVALDEIGIADGSILPILPGNGIGCGGGRACLAEMGARLSWALFAQNPRHTRGTPRKNDALGELE